MKKFALALFVTVAAFVSAYSQACVINQNSSGFFSPAADSFPCVERNVAFSHALQLSIPSGYTGFTVDSIVITNITGFPTGLSYACNPASCVFYGGTKGCINFQGTTADTIGTYTLTIQGTATGTVPVVGTQTVSLSTLSSFGGPSPTYQLTVIDSGSPCRGTVDIRGFSAELNSAIYIYPNPNNGTFEFKLDAGRRINGEIMVFDATGNKVFNQTLDVIGFYNTTIDLSKLAKGLYTLQLRTADGFASKKISIE
jgi:hypothetical protein